MAMDPNSVEERFIRFLDAKPVVPASAYIHKSAVVQGDVRLGEHASVWPNVVLRADINFIEIGEGSNVQDGAVVHLADAHPVMIGKYVTIGHLAMVHACTIEDECLIGMGAIILDGAVIGRNSIIGAGTLITEGMVVPPGSLVVGAPGKVIRVLDEKRRGEIKSWAKKYVEVAKGFKARGL